MAKIDSVVAELETQRSEIDRALKLAKEIKSIYKTSFDSDRGNPPIANPTPRKRGIAVFAVEILKDKPLTTKDLLAAMRLRGFRVGGAKPAVTLYSALARHKKVLEKRKDGMWHHIAKE